MSTVTLKQEFRAPMDVLQDEIQRLKLPAQFTPAAVSPGALVGTWVNVDHHTRGMVRLMITANGNAITVHGFGACTPTPCDWGTAPGIVYAENVTATPGIAFTATYNFSFKHTTLVGHLLDGALLVESFDHFTDKSGRSDYYAQYILAQ